MPPERKGLRKWIVPKRPIRLAVLFGIFVTIYATDSWRRRWSPDIEINTTHYTVYSTATPEQTEKMAAVVEMLYEIYKQTFAETTDLPTEHPTFKLKLFKDREEFHHCNLKAGWAEAFYLHPYCYAYYSQDGLSPYHWMVHEAVHQLNREFANFDLAKWADEGVAEYFSTSEIRQNKILLGRIDSRTYPIWWLTDLKLTGDLEKDIDSGQIIPLAKIISGKGGPNINKNVNLYYIHWWSLSHFLFEQEEGKYKAGYLKAIAKGAKTDSFEKHIAPISDIQNQWYGYLCKVAEKY